MSSTELYGIRKSGNMFHMADVHNGWRSGPAVWEALERKYLPSLPKPSWVMRPEEEEPYYSRTSQMFKQEGMKEVWGLMVRNDVSRADKIVLGSTLDNQIVLRDNFDELVRAFYGFDATTSLPEQAAIIENYPKIYGVAWNQTSVCGDPIWGIGRNGKPYNIHKRKEHRDLFKFLGPRPKQGIREMLGMPLK